MREVGRGGGSDGEREVVLEMGNLKKIMKIY